MAHTKQYTVNLGARGRVVLPTPVRRSLGLSEGDKLVVTVEETGAITVRRLKEQAREAIGLYKHVAPQRPLVDELLAERRDEARRESEA